MHIDSLTTVLCGFGFMSFCSSQCIISNWHCLWVLSTLGASSVEIGIDSHSHSNLLSTEDYAYLLIEPLIWDMTAITFPISHTAERLSELVSCQRLPSSQIPDCVLTLTQWKFNIMTRNWKCWQISILMTQHDSTSGRDRFLSRGAFG